ncbi:MAG: S8 family peptidase [Clostridiales bacterium]|jgi:subtilisin family serine protease|nr:S8 family peptidase [Clostridiales bacterium]
MNEQIAWDEFSQADFIESPNVADFITRESDPIRTKIDGWPYARMSKSLDGNFAVVYIPEEYIDQVLSDPGVTIRTNQPTLLQLMGLAELENSGVFAIQQHPYLNLRGQGVIVGFVDTGIDYTQPAFQYEDGATRIKYIWDQTISGCPPDDFGYGSEYDENAVNEALNTAEPRAAVPHEDTIGHGTFLASVAAGKDIGAAPDANIIAVKLREARGYHMRSFQMPPEAENVYTSTDVMMGVEYIIRKARQLSMPAAICIGLGSNQSSHTGNTILDDYLANVGAHTGFAICVAAGNEAHAGHHFSGSISSAEQKLDMLIRCDRDNLPGGISLGIFTGTTDRTSVSITSPLGEVVARRPVKSSEIFFHQYILERSFASIEYSFPTSKSGSQLIIIHVADPTPGIWTIAVYGDIILVGSVHAWLPATGLTPGIEFMTPDSYYTVTEPGVGIGVITTGAYSALKGSLYPLSSWGPTRLPALAPDFCAPGEDVSGIFPSGPGAMSGTSVAAAITTGACALMLEWGIVDGMDPSLNTNLIKTYLIRGCAQDAGMGYPNEQWGYGRLDLLNTFMKMR